MRAWKIHLCWGIVAIITAGAWGRWTAARREADADVRLSPDAAALEEPPQARSDPPPLTVNAPRASLPPSTARLLPNPFDLPVDEIRVRIKSSNVEEAYHAVERIINLKDPTLKRELLLECVRSSHPQVRQIALGGLVKVMGDDAIPVVQGILVSDPETFVRRRAAELLGGLPDKGSTELLLDAYRTSEGGLKIAAASSLYRFGNSAPATELLPVLAADLDSDDGAVRKDAVDRIGKLQTPIAIPALMRALRDTSGNVRAQAATALGKIDAPEVPALLEPLLEDPYIDARDNAKDAIGAYRQRHPK